MLQREVNIVELDSRSLHEFPRFRRHNEIRISLEVKRLQFGQVDGLGESDQFVPCQNQTLERSTATQAFWDHLQDIVSCGEDLHRILEKINTYWMGKFN